MLGRSKWLPCECQGPVSLQTGAEGMVRSEQSGGADAWPEAARSIMKLRPHPRTALRAPAQT